MKTTNKGARKCKSCGEPMEQARENKEFCGNSCRAKHHRALLAEEEREREIMQKLSRPLLGITPPTFEGREQPAIDPDMAARLEAVMLEIAQEERIVEGHMREIAEAGAKQEAELMELPGAIEKTEARIKELEGLQRLSPVDFYNRCLNDGLAKLMALARSGNVPPDFRDLIYPQRLKSVLVTAIPVGGSLWGEVEEGCARLRLAIAEKRQERDQLAKRLEIAMKAKETPGFSVAVLNMQVNIAKRRIGELRQKLLEPPAVVVSQPAVETPAEAGTDVAPSPANGSWARANPVQQPLAVVEPRKPKLPKGEIGGADLLCEQSETFVLDGALGVFIGRMDRKMAAIGLTGDSGSGKSTFSLTLAGLFSAQGFTVKYFSLEEGLGDSMKRKIRAAGIGNDVRFAEGASLHTIRQDAKRFDVVFIDSFTILDAGQDELEKLRKDFPETIFVCIHQKTTGGTIRGGTKIFYNSTAIINIEIDHDRGRLAVMKKSRYGTEGFMYNISDGEVFRAGDW